MHYIALVIMLCGHTPDIQGLFISDSGILVGYEVNNKFNCLSSLLQVIRFINQEMLNANVMLTTTIAYGQFSYHQRIEFPVIEKNPVYGNGYISAFLDNEYGKPKIQQGQFLIDITNLPFDKEEILSNQIDIFKFIHPRQNDTSHLYFYWMVNDPGDICSFEQYYSDSYNLKFRGMLDALHIYQS